MVKISHMNRIAEDAYWLDLMSLFRVTYWSYGDLLKQFLWGKNSFYHQSTYVEPRFDQICSCSLSQKLLKITCFLIKNKGDTKIQY